MKILTQWYSNFYAAASYLPSPRLLGTALLGLGTRVDMRGKLHNLVENSGSFAFCNISFPAANGGFVSEPRVCRRLGISAPPLFT
jgi:hypothetical protein